MGQGTGPKALSLIKECMVTGSWALLQNCHLATSWLPELVKIVEDIPKRKHEP